MASHIMATSSSYIALAAAAAAPTFTRADQSRLAELNKAKKGKAKAWARDNPGLENERLGLQLAQQVVKTKQSAITTPTVAARGAAVAGM
jgi:hypothetical protein